MVSWRVHAFIKYATIVDIQGFTISIGKGLEQGNDLLNYMDCHSIDLGSIHHVNYKPDFDIKAVSRMVIYG